MIDAEWEGIKSDPAWEEGQDWQSSEEAVDDGRWGRLGPRVAPAGRGGKGKGGRRTGGRRAYVAVMELRGVLVTEQGMARQRVEWEAVSEEIHEAIKFRGL